VTATYGVSVNPLLEIWLILSRELRKNVRSVKGLVMFGISVLGAMVSTFRLPKFEEVLNKMQELSATEMHQGKAEIFGRMYYDEKTGEVLADAPIKLVFLFFIAVWLAPLLVAVLGFDSVSSDMQYRSVRYWTLRTRRGSYYVGKFLGLWMLVSLMTLVMHGLIWSVTIIRAEATAASVFSWGSRFWLVSLPINAAWCGVATFVGSLFRTPMLGLLITCATFFSMFFIGFIVGRGADVASLRYFYPNTFDAWLLSSQLEHAMTGLGVCLAYAVGTTAIGSLIFARRDV
jgi:ABC-type transport system involved in multi-copper enzyme maturation permease subunit